MQSLSPILAADPDSEAQLAHIRAVADETLAVWPEARAAVLFGSRARGDHRPDSDWDVAFITDTGDRIRPIPCDLPATGLSPAVQCLAVPEHLLARRCVAIGDVVRGIARDGQLLSGCWDQPETEGLMSTMQPDEYVRLLTGAIDTISHAANPASRVGLTGNLLVDLGQCAAFTTASVAMAEELAKAMLGRRGVDYRKVHDLDKLGGDADRAGHAHLAATLRALNGNTIEDHLARYTGVGADDCQRAVTRLLAVSVLLAQELDAGATDRRFQRFVPGLAHLGEIAAKAGADDLHAALSRPAVPYEEVSMDFEAPDAALAVVQTVLDARRSLAESLEDLAVALGDRGASPPPPPPSEFDM